MVDKYSITKPGQATMHQLLPGACDRGKLVASSIESDSLATLTWYCITGKGYHKISTAMYSTEHDGTHTTITIGLSYIIIITHNMVQRQFSLHKSTF